MKRLLVAALLLSTAVARVLAASPPASLPALRVSDNHRFLVRADGTPFFWLGDTAWQLFHWLNREESELYLQKRAEQGFTVIQAVALAEFNGLDQPNRYGHHALRDNDPRQPNESYFEHIDWVLSRAAAHGLT